MFLWWILWLIQWPVVYCGEEMCTFTQDVLEGIASNQENRNQLSKLFYPINKASPSYALIVYLTNHSSKLLPFCDQGMFPWRQFPNVNDTIDNPGSIWWVMWSTNALHSLKSPMLLDSSSFGVVTFSYEIFFNKISPFVFPTPMACIAILCIIEEYDDDTDHLLGQITVQLYNIISPAKYTEQLLDVHYPGQFYGTIYRGIPKTDIREFISISTPIYKADKLPLAFIYSNLNSLDILCALLAYCLPLFFYKRERNWLEDFKKKTVHGRGLLSLFWGTAAFGFVFSWQAVTRKFTITCLDPQLSYEFKQINCTGNMCAIAYLCITSAFLAYVHSSAITLPPPRIIQIILNMLFKPCRMPSSHLRDFTGRLVLMLGIFGLNMFAFALSIAIPAQVLLLTSNFYLKGTAIFIFIFTLGAIITLISVIFTIDQVFSSSHFYRLPCKQASLQSLALIITFFLLASCGMFLLSVHYLMQLSKDGEKTQSISMAILHVMTSISYLLMPKLVQKVVALLEKGTRDYFNNTLYDYSP